MTSDMIVLISSVSKRLFRVIVVRLSGNLLLACCYTEELVYECRLVGSCCELGLSGFLKSD
jgi:hypothetical protein